MNDCVPEATCLNTAGSFVCVCPPSRDDTNEREGEGCVGEINISYNIVVIYNPITVKTNPSKILQR